MNDTMDLLQPEPPAFEGMPKIARLSREIIITEKIDGSNAQIYINSAGNWWAGSRSRWLSKETDNFGFWQWVYDNQEELLKLGEGRHRGEWWGSGIQRRYGMLERHFSLFNTTLWWNNVDRPFCCDVVPVLYQGDFCTEAVEDALWLLRREGSRAVPGFMDPEGVVVYHTAANVMFKKTLRNDEQPKRLLPPVVPLLGK
jgi:hypothetical protein